MSKIFICALLTLGLNIVTVEGKTRLFLLAVKPNVTTGKAIMFDVYLYNDDSKSISAPDLKFLWADWLLDDTMGKRPPRSGGHAVVNTSGPSNVVLPARAMLYRRTQFNVDAQPGDLVTITVGFGGTRSLKSNPVVVYCLARKER